MDNKINPMTAPPSNKDSELNVLGTLIKNNNLMNKAIEKLNSDDFYFSKHILIFKSMIELYNNDINFDEMILFNKIKKEDPDLITRSELFQISSFAFEATFESHIKNIIETSNQRKILKLSEIIFNQEMDSDKKISILEDEIFKIGTTKEEDKVMSSEEVFISSMKKIEDAFNTKEGITGIKTGVGVIDTMLNGLQRKNMIVFGARPSCGKTAFALKLIQKIEGNCLLIQLDMGLDEVGRRMMSSDSKVSNMRVSRGRMNDPEWEKVSMSFINLSNKKNLFFYSPSEATVTDIRAKAKDLKMRKGLDVIIIDHIGKITPEHGSTSYEQMKIISKKLKSLFRELDVAGVVLCQLSRAVEQRNDKHPIMSDLRDSGNIEEDK